MSGALRRASMLACLVLLAGVLPALAQVSTGEIFGKATDGTGAVLPGVTVTLSGPALITSQTAVTTESGAYRFPRIPIGTYVVTFETEGEVMEPSSRRSGTRSVRCNGLCWLADPPPGPRICRW